MKRQVHLALALVLAALALPGARAAVLEAPLPAYASPDASAPILGTAQTGTALSNVPAPAGWAAVELSGPHAVYVTHKDTLKNFEVRPGAAYLSAPRANAPVLGLAGENDVAEFADVEGKFNKFSLNKALVAYVRVPVTPVAPVATITPVAVPAHDAAPAVQAAATPAPAADVLPPLMDDLPGTLPQNIPANRPVVPGQSVESGEPRLARTFFGIVASSRNPLRPRRPYDFQLNDDGGTRIAYLDISTLLLTERIEAFVGRPVS
ncbi:MAG: hypothetical protein RLZZ50_747, partial [Verrucomicrobiota bacterium]